MPKSCGNPAYNTYLRAFDFFQFEWSRLLEDNLPSLLNIDYSTKLISVIDHYYFLINPEIRTHAHLTILFFSQEPQSPIE